MLTPTLAILTLVPLLASAQPDCWPGDPTCFELACPPGLGRSAPNLPCYPCPEGTYNPGGVYGPCRRCPRGSVTVTLGSTACGCKPGYGTSDNGRGPCRPCTNGTYSSGGEFTPCTRCPGSGFAVTPPKATDVSQCTCRAGYGSTSWFANTCQRCPPGTYADAPASIAFPGVPAQQAGKGAPHWGPNFRPCTPCCPGGVGTCALTTKRSGATSYAECISVPPPQPPQPTICCGVSSCAHPVPRPPTTMPASATAILQSIQAAERMQQEQEQLRRWQQDQQSDENWDWDPRDSSSGSWGTGSSSGSWGGGSSGSWGAGSSGSAGGSGWAAPVQVVSVEHNKGIAAPASWPPAEALTICSAHPRVAVGSNSGGVSNNTLVVMVYYADLTAGTGCMYNAGNYARFFCTGNQLAPYLVLTAAHCVDAALTLSELAATDRAKCQNLALVAVKLCYAATYVSGGFSCGTSVAALGVSWYEQASTAAPHDQAIIFSGTFRGGPYYEYNYIENIRNAFTSSSYTYQALSYTGEGNANDGLCGCVACPGVTCNLARTGPANGPLEADSSAAGNGAVNAQLEACGGSSGSCMTIQGSTCCIGVDSYEYIADGGQPCTSYCTNYWSTISVTKPLSALWSTVRWKLPKTPPDM